MIITKEDLRAAICLIEGVLERDLVEPMGKVIHRPPEAGHVAKVSNNQLDMMRHCAGMVWDRGSFMPYRNHYYASTSVDGYEELMDLVDQGLMVVRFPDPPDLAKVETTNNLDYPPAHTFSLTDEGCHMLGLSSLDAIEVRG